MEEIGKSERAETPERRLSLQRRSYFREYAPTHPPPPSRWNSLAAAQPTDTANLRPHVPSETRASKGGGRERTSGGAGAIRPPAGLRRPQPVTCGESAPSPGLSALHADPISPAAAAPRPAHEDGARRQVPLGDCGAPALELVTTSRGDRASEQPAAKGALAGRGGSGRAGPEGAGGRRKVLPNTVGLLRLILNGSGPGGGGGSDIPGERSRRRHLLLHSLLASLSPARSPRAASLRLPPPPSTTHTQDCPFVLV